jgi:transcriptional regulator with XRE-family HTH domain
MDANISQRRLSEASGVPQSYLSRIERGAADPSIAVVVAIGDALGAELTIHLRPGAGPRIRDRLQAPIVEALLTAAHTGWRRLVEEPVFRPVRGVIDLVLAQPTVVVATEVQSEMRRLEQQLRWATEKSLALPSSAAWSMISGGKESIPISRLLVLRSTASNRELARSFEQTLATAYPARTGAAIAALRDQTVGWPGSAVVWAVVDARGARLLDGPPRGVNLGR